ncbi:hypothetical protein [Microbaculum marinum]|uniref:Uncharacterized protein n=1 Tax=Microbaculum marinum TaxID=1764581 RepID=A0AAW9RXF6_9HYPH
MNDAARHGTTARISGLREFSATVSLAVALAAMPGLTMAGYIESPVCQAHLDKIEGKLSNVSMTFENGLDEAGSADCEAMHGQVRFMLAARNFYKRCATGTERVQRIDFTEGSISQITDRISQDCSSN